MVMVNVGGMGIGRIGSGCVCLLACLLVQCMRDCTRGS